MKIKNIFKISALALFVLLGSCDDFDETNVNPLTATGDQVQPEYFLNGSIVGAQQNPHVAERAFVLMWKTAGRQHSTNGIAVGSTNDSWITDYFNSLSGWLTKANEGIKIADTQMENDTDKAYTHNLKQILRIWRVYLMSEFTDQFGPFPLNGFQGIDPDFSSEEDVYLFMLNELKDAASLIEVDAAKPDAKFDYAYDFNYSKWVKYANSMRMRLAMRLTNVKPDVAKMNFEEAAANGFISTGDEIFKIQETGGWNDLTGVMTRQWNMQEISVTLNNIYIGLGGVSSEAQLDSDAKKDNIKSSDYLGVRYQDHFATKTNDPFAGYWLDGLPEYIDPRAYALFPLPGDFDNPEFNFYPSWATNNVTDVVRSLTNENGDAIDSLDATYTFNAFGLGDWGEKGAKNNAFGFPAMNPRLKNSLRNGSSQRVFFGSWESYFLIAEAAVRGWNVPMNAEEAYEAGINESFNYWGLSGYFDEYVNSENYNRIGTSVKFSHTAEAADKTMNYKDGYTKQMKTVTYKYPKNTIYKNGTVNNDALTKIITQKYLAQFPWLPLEAWSDHRRLGLPFFENPAVEQRIESMSQLTDANYMESSWDFYPQRLPFPSSLRNSVPESYNQAVGLLNGEDNVYTPLWWSGKANQ